MFLYSLSFSVLTYHVRGWDEGGVLTAIVFTTGSFWVSTDKCGFRPLNWVSVAGFGLRPLAWVLVAKLGSLPLTGKKFAYRQ